VIQTRIKDDRTNEWVDLHPNDPRYWEGRYVYEPYPKVLFKASVGAYQDGDLAQKRVENQQQHDDLNKRESGWKESPDEARAYLDALEREMSTAAAESAHADRNMSASAQRERRAAEESTDGFVVDVPAPKKRGRPKKDQTLN
jgi:septal ring factor EnvC (AmiA/AmiB activator)